MEGMEGREGREGRLRWWRCRVSFLHRVVRCRAWAGYTHHNLRFDLGEDVLPIGVAALTHTLMYYLL